MGAEILLYGYGIVCLSMLVFNVLYGLHLRSDDRRMDAKTEVIRRRVTEQLERLQENPSGPTQTVQALSLIHISSSARCFVCSITAHFMDLA